MRQLAIGLTIGFLFGAALAASAGYIDRDQWTHIDPLEQLGYIAGVVDTIEAVRIAVDAIGANHTADMVTTADHCTDTLKLGQVRDIAIGAFAKRPDVTPAAALFLELADCSFTPPAQSQPSQQ